MTRPFDVKKFHADYDKHPGDRIHLFGALAEKVSPKRVLYPGSYVDIAPSVWFDEVRYVDTDNRAARFFKQSEAVTELVAAKRAAVARPTAPISIEFEHRDYSSPLDAEPGSVDLLVSLYAGFVSEHCTRYLASGGYLLANGHHGDVAMASLDPGYRLAAVVTSANGRYRCSTANLDSYLIPKNGQQPTVASLHSSGRGIAYTKAPFAYLFQRS